MGVAIAPDQHRAFMAVLPREVKLTMYSGQKYAFPMSRFRKQGANPAYELYSVGMWYTNKENLMDVIDLPIAGNPDPFTFDPLLYLPLEPTDTDFPLALRDAWYPFTFDYANHQHSGYDPLRTKEYQRGWYWEWYMVQYPYLGVIAEDEYPWKGFTYQAGGNTGEDCFVVRMSNGVQKSNSMRVKISVRPASHPGSGNPYAATTLPFGSFSRQNMVP